MIRKVIPDQFYFAIYDKQYLEREFTSLFKYLDETYSYFLGENTIYFDEVVILIYSSIGYKIVFRYPNSDDVSMFTYSHIKELLEELPQNAKYDFHKDQEGEDCDYVALINNKKANYYIFLNNKDLSLYEIENKNPQAWRSMNEINLSLYNRIYQIMEKIKE